MAELRIELKDAIYEELKTRAEKREVSLEEYAVKALKYHLKQIRKVEKGMQEDHELTLDIVAQAEEAGLLNQ